MNKISNIGPSLIAVLVIVGFVSAVIVLLFKPVQVSGDVGDILKMLLGALSAKFCDVVSYHIGSSAGSKAKDATIQSITTADKP